MKTKEVYSILFTLAVLMVVVLILLRSSPIEEKEMVEKVFSNTLWEERSLDVLGQALLVVIGVMSVVLLFREEGET